MICLDWKQWSEDNMASIDSSKESEGIIVECWYKYYNKFQVSCYFY